MSFLPGDVYRPSYKSTHRAMVKRRNDCEKCLASLKDKDSVYAQDIKRCHQMLSRIVTTIEEDPV